MMKREYYQKYELTPKASINPKSIHKPKTKPHAEPTNNTSFNFFKNFGSDEILLTALIIALATDDEPDF